MLILINNSGLKRIICQVQERNQIMSLEGLINYIRVLTFCALSSGMIGRVEIEVEYENIGVLKK